MSAEEPVVMSTEAPTVDPAAADPAANPNHINSSKLDSNGAYLAQTMLLIMAVLPIYFGAKAMVAQLKSDDEKIAKGEKIEKSEEAEVITSKDALKFPLTASIALCSLYAVTKLIDPVYVNYLLSAYFMILGVAAITSMFTEMTFLRKFFPAIFNSDEFSINFHSTNAETKEKSEILAGKFTYIEIFYGVVSIFIGVWYILTKHWISNNIFGLAFSMNAVALLQIGSFQTGVILLSGLFFYDVFWVFGTEVMVTVAKNIDAPIKILFPVDFLENGVFGTQHSMLGLGDIVLPGVLIAKYCEFDYELFRNGHTKTHESKYFKTGLISYILGLVITMVVMNVYKHAQPALLYLVPTCVLIPIFFSIIQGQFRTLWTFGEEDEKRIVAEKQAEAEGKKDQ